MHSQRIAIDCDVTAKELKQTIVQHLKAQYADVTDLDFCSEHPGADYPEIGFHLAQRIQDGSFERGILLCGTGLGMAMIANKVYGVYAGVCHDVYSAQRLRKSNDAQILTMGARVIGPELAKAVVDAWMVSEFAGGGSLPKVQQMRALESQSFGRR